MFQSPIFLQTITLTITLLVFMAKSYQNISLGSTLTPLGSNTQWLSPSGDFAFGFLPLNSNATTFLLAIWFAKIPSKTTVWFANGGKPIESSAQLKLIANNQLTLSDESGRVIWTSSNGNNNAITTNHAAMLDNGNLVVVGSEGSTLWQSFKNPTDTILPSQILDPGANLVARLMEDDYSKGRFELSFTTDGNLTLYTVAWQPNWSMANKYFSYWSSNTGGNASQLVFDVSGTVYVLLNNNTVFNVTGGQMNSAQNLYQRATLDADGVFRQYVYPKNGSTSKGVWNEDWTIVGFVPSNICTAIAMDKGSGACGYNSYCAFNQSRADCKCPPQYSFINPERKYEGCMPDFDPQNCLANESDIVKHFTLIDLIDVNWPLSDYEMYSDVYEDTCRNLCLMDCFCSLALFWDGVCWKEKLPLTNGRIDSYVGAKTILKVATGGAQANSQNALPKKEERTWKVFGLTFLGCSLLVTFLLISIIITFTISWRRTRKQKLQTLSDLNLLPFSYSELVEITNGFREELGSGNSGVVYKGFLQDEAKTCVAVKKLNNISDDADTEFINEVKTIAKTHHRNLVRLLGFCSERLIVYEFMSNGTLVEFLCAVVKPEWHKRVQIALGIARGLTYLHEECTSQIIHCDIKPQNILLDADFVARIADFGLAKRMKTDQTRTHTNIRGTRGYIAPEWFKGRSITAKVDVYSFGIILLEIICCRMNVIHELEHEDNAVLSYWADDCYRVGKLDLLIEGDEEAIYDIKRVERFVKVALWCIQGEPSLRPTMTKVTQMLDGAVAVPIPPDLGSYISSI